MSKGNKTARITVRFEPEEARRIVKEAEVRKMTPAAYLRMLANQKPAQYPEIQVLLGELVSEINRIGVNINQIVKNHNTSLYSNTDKDNLSASMQKLNLLTKRVVTILGDK